MKVTQNSQSKWYQPIQVCFQQHDFCRITSYNVCYTKLLRIQRVIEPTEDAFSKSIADEAMSDLAIDTVDDSNLQETVDTNSEDDAPIVKYINKVLLDAVRRGASDLHFEPYEKTYRIRFRIDGILYEIATPPVALSSRFSARLKVMSRLDIAERRLPQDGRIKLRLAKNKSIDLRVSTLPTMWGEKVVLRILDSRITSYNVCYTKLLRTM